MLLRPWGSVVPSQRILKPAFDCRPEIARLGFVVVHDPNRLRFVLLQFSDRVVQTFVPAADLNLAAAVNVENVGFFCFPCHEVFTPL